MTLTKRTPEEIALSDFQYWCRWPMGLDLWECQRRWADFIQDGLEDEAIKGILILGPPDFGKTSRITIPLILWLFARSLNTRIILASGKDDYAEQIGRAVARRIIKQSNLRRFGIMPSGEKWSDQEYLINRPNWEDKDASLLCIGSNSEVLSQRSDVNICDDIITPKNSKTQGKRDNMRHFLWTEFGSRLERGGKWVMLGHRCHQLDAYGEIAKKYRWKVMEDPAIRNDHTKEIITPEHWTYDELCETRSQDAGGFATFYQQKPIEFGVHCSQAMIEPMKDRNRPLLMNIEDHVRARYDKITLSIDPAWSTNRWSKFCVILVWGIAGKRRDLLYVFRDKVTPERMLDILYMKIRIYKPDEIFPEGNAAQIFITVNLKKEFPDLEQRIKPIYTLNPNKRLDEELGNLFELISGGASNFTLPYGDKAAQIISDIIAEELVTFPDGRFTDCLMAWYLNERGLGNIINRAAKGFIHPRGVVGAVSDQVRRGAHHGV